MGVLISDSSKFSGDIYGFTSDSGTFSGDIHEFTGDSGTFSGNSHRFTGDSHLPNKTVCTQNKNSLYKLVVETVSFTIIFVQPSPIEPSPKCVPMTGPK